jgi:hypothetical protein
MSQRARHPQATGESSTSKKRLSQGPQFQWTIEEPNPKEEACNNPNDLTRRYFYSHPKAFSTPALPPAQYIERGTRWVERKEAESLSLALHDMDLRAETEVHLKSEPEIYDAAKEEAARLVAEHQNRQAAVSR